MKTSRLVNVFLIVLIDMLGFSLILPLLPFYAEKFGATPLLVGMLVSVYAAAQLVAAPILGRLSDCYGRRPILVLSLAGTSAGFILLGFAEPIGRLIASGVLVVLVQGVFISRLTARFSETQLILWGSILMAVSLAAWAVVPNLVLLLVVLMPLSLATGVLNTVLSSALTKAVYPEEVGGTLGLATSAESLSRAIAPVIGGVLLGSVGTSAPGVIAALIMAWVVTFVVRRLVRRPDPPLPARKGIEGFAEAQP